MSSFYRAVSAGLLLASLVLAIVAAATNNWIVVEHTHIGLFWVCGGNICVNTLDSLFWNESCRSKDQAAQAFVIIAIIATFVVLVLVTTRRFLMSSSIGKSIAYNVPSTVDAVLAAFATVSFIISWACVAAIHDQCVCQGNTSSCGLNYSWAFALIASAAVMVVTILLFISRD